jgi:hypothetical protein
VKKIFLLSNSVDIKKGYFGEIMRPLVGKDSYGGVIDLNCKGTVYSHQKGKIGVLITD